MMQSELHRRRQQLLDRFLAGEIDHPTYHRMLGEIEHDSAYASVGPQSIGDRATRQAAGFDPFAAPPRGGVLATGMQIGEFLIEERIGRGGMGEVWKAFDPIGERHVVIKVLPPELQHNPEEVVRVRQVFTRVHQLQHQHICPVYLLGETPEAGCYLVMKFVDGVTLSQYRREYAAHLNGFPLSEVVRILGGVALALDYAHSRKVIHRDIKPQNILVSRDGSDVQVVDFGLAAEIRTSMTRVSRVRMDTSGTYPYMAPEQWRGDYQDGKADQYALGVVAFEMLSGRLPFEAPDDFVLRQCVLNEAVPVLGDQPAGVNAALARAMAKQRDQRFENCAAFITALENPAQQETARSETGEATDPRYAEAAGRIDDVGGSKRSAEEQAEERRQKEQVRAEQLEREKAAAREVEERRRQEKLREREAANRRERERREQEERQAASQPAASPTELRPLVLAAPQDVSLRRRYLACRTPELEKADEVRVRRCLAAFTAVPAALIGLLVGIAFAANDDGVINKDWNDCVSPMAAGGIVSVLFVVPFSALIRMVEWKWKWYEVVWSIVTFVFAGPFVGFFFGALGGSVILLILNKLLSIDQSWILWPLICAVQGGFLGWVIYISGPKDEPVKEIDKPEAVKFLGPLPAAAYLLPLRKMRARFLNEPA